MIENMRKFSGHWSMKLVMIMLIIAFGFFWGGQDGLHMIGLGKSDTVATVGGQKITAQQLALRIQQDVLGRGIKQEDIKKYNLDRAVLESLIQEKLLEKEAVKMGMFITDSEIRDFLRKQQVFHDKDGNFDPARFQAIVNRRELGLSEGAFVESQKNLMLRLQLAQAMTVNIESPLSLAEPLYLWQNQKRRIKVAVLDPANTKLEQKATDEDLQAFYDKNIILYKAPEFRNITYVMMTPEALKAQVNVTDDEAQAEFDFNKVQYKGKKFKEVKASIIDQLKLKKATEMLYEQSTKFEDDLGGGSKLEEAAEKFGFEIKQFDTVDQNGNFDPYSDAKTKPLTVEEKAIVKEAFVQEEEIPGSVIDLSQGRLAVARVDKVTVARDRSFDEMKTKVKEHWALEQRFEATRKKAEEIASQVNKPGAFAIVAGQNKLKVSSLKIGRRGPIGPSNVTLTPEFLNGIFSKPVGGAMIGAIPSKDQKSIHIIIGSVEALETGAKPSAKELESFKAALDNQYKDDFVLQFINSLRKKYPVEINKKFFS